MPSARQPQGHVVQRLCPDFHRLLQLPLHDVEHAHGLVAGHEGDPFVVQPVACPDGTLRELRVLYFFDDVERFALVNDDFAVGSDRTEVLTCGFFSGLVVVLRFYLVL